MWSLSRVSFLLAPPTQSRKLLRIAPNIKLIVQTVPSDEGHTVELYRRGIAASFLGLSLLICWYDAFGALLPEETWIDDTAVNWVIEAYRAQETALLNPRTERHLTPKETAIITCITQGMRNKEIAFQLRTTEQVIKNYLRRIYDKLGVASRLELALYCLHNKIIKEVSCAVAPRGPQDSLMTIRGVTLSLEHAEPVDGLREPSREVYFRILGGLFEC